MIDEPFRCKTFTLGLVTDPEQSIDRFKSLAEMNNITELLLRRFAPENIGFFMDDSAEPLERRFSVDELDSGLRRPSVLGLFEEENFKDRGETPNQSRSLDGLVPSRAPKSPEPTGDLAKMMKKRRSVPHLTE